MLKEEKYLIKNMNLTDANHHCKNWVDWIADAWWDKTFEPQKVKKNITILNFMTTLNNVALQIEIGFELQGCLMPLQKLEMSMINVKT